MSTLITVNDGTADTTAPALVLGYSASRESRNIVYNLITGANTAVVLREPALRNGELELFYTSEADAFEAYGLHARAASFTFEDTDVASAGMDYVLNGSLSIEQTDNRRRWIVTVGFQEVAP